MADTRENIDCRARIIASANIRKMREIAKAVYDNPALLLDFERDPNGTAARINGFMTPEGVHIHIADASNRFYPAEDEGVFGAEDHDRWERVEIRVGYKTFSFVGCG